MRVKQKSVRVFEIECENIAEFGAYLDKNGVLLVGFLLLLKGDTKGVFAKECKKRGLCYAQLGGECTEVRAAPKKDSEERPQEPQIEEPTNVEKTQEEVLPPQDRAAEPKKEILKPQPPLPFDASPSADKPQAKTVVITKNLRSGEDINTDSDVTVTGRINSGAKVKTNGNAMILGEVDGDVEVWGDYLVIKSIGKGTVAFRGESVKKEQLSGKAKLVTFDGKLCIKDI